MYCEKCGQQISENGQFCSHCGHNKNSAYSNYVSTVSQKINSFQGEKNMFFFFSLGATIAIIILMFQKWINIPITELFVNSKSEFSLYEVTKVVKNIHSMLSYMDSSNIETLITIGFMGLFVVSIILLVVYCFKLFTSVEKSSTWGNAAMIFVLILSIVFIVSVFIIDGYLQDQSGGFMSGTISLTAIPYFTAILALMQKFIFIKKLNEKVWWERNEKEKLRKQSIIKISCDKCGYRYDSDSSSCPKCGNRPMGKSASATWICRFCNTYNDFHKIFCKNCGKSK